MPGRREVVRPVAAVLTGLLMFASGVAVGDHQHGSAPGGSPVDEALTVIDQRAVSDPSPGAVDDAAIAGALGALADPWASYSSNDRRSVSSEQDSGSYSGTGLWLREAAAGSTVSLTVTSVLAGSPAQTAGIEVGDELRSIDGWSVAGGSVEQAVDRLRGPAGSAVAVAVSRGALTRTLTLVRRQVHDGDVTVTRPTPQVVQVAVSRFGPGVADQVAAALADVGTGTGTDSVLLDLRGNPGGLLDEAVRTASLFLDGGPVVQYSERGVASRTVTASPGGDTTAPLAVLVDGASASAAEVVAGALQDRGRAVVVGSRTFGKGSVQQPVALSDGSTLTLTVGHYRTPSGRSLDGTGLEPDVVVSPGSGSQAAVDRALTILAGLLADSGGGG